MTERPRIDLRVVGRFGGTLAVAGVGLSTPSVALAHLDSTGLGPFYDGLAHLFVTPVDLLSILAVAMLAGLSGVRAGRWALFGVALAWLVGGCMGMGLDGDLARLTLIASIAPLAIGLAVALDVGLPAWVTTAIAIIVGGGLGLLNGIALRAAGADFQPLLGIISGVFVCVTLAAAITVRVTAARDWRRIVVRVAGSWITAISLLMVGWAFRA